MQLEQIVTSLDVSKRLDVALKKVGIKIRPLFTWADVDGNGEFTEIQYEDDDSCTRYDFIPALTASEIGEILSKRLRYWTDLRKAYCEVMDLTEDIIIPEQRVLNMMEQPDIGGEVIIYLADNGLLNNN